MKSVDDINDTLRDEGEDAARERLDKAKRYHQGANQSQKSETEEPCDEGEASAETKTDGQTGGDQADERWRQRENALQLWWHGDKNSDTDRAWLVEGLLPEIGMALISGQFGTFKTFVALDLSLSLMAGETFAGRSVNRRCGVLFVAVEGAFEIPVRLECALETKFPEIKGSLPFAMASECRRLLDPSALETLESTARAAADRMHKNHDVDLGAIIIDTMSTAVLVKNEDANSEAARVMHMLNQLARKLGCIVIGVDHFGKTVETGTRGASAKEASADAVLAVLADKESSGAALNPRMVIRKVRGAPTSNEVPFSTKVVDADDGQTTLVIGWLAERGSAAPPKEIWPRALRVFRDALVAALERGTPRPAFGSGPTVRAVDRETVRTEFVRRFPAEGDTEEKRQANTRQAFKRGLDYARARHLVGIENEGKATWIWLINPATAPP